MRLDCVSGNSVGLKHGWVVIDQNNGGIVAHDERQDSAFAWMMAAHNLAEALTDIEQTIHNTHPQQFAVPDKG